MRSYTADLRPLTLHFHSQIKAPQAEELQHFALPPCAPLLLFLPTFTVRDTCNYWTTYPHLIIAFTAENLFLLLDILRQRLHKCHLVADNGRLPVGDGVLETKLRNHGGYADREGRHQQECRKEAQSLSRF